MSVVLAKQLSTIILSSDSRQFYRQLSIGTAKPTQEEQGGIQHYFIDSHDLSDELNSGRFEQEALGVLEREFQSHDEIILTGGSGMFSDALCYGLDDLPASQELKDELINIHRTSGLEPLLEELKSADPEYYAQVDKSNPARIIRALEVIRLSGKKYSELRVNKTAIRPFVIRRFVIDIPRELLYQRINERVDQMFEAGLIEEAKSVYHLRHLKSLNTVGYKELFAYFDGSVSLEEAKNQIKQNSRRYAKRQLTWFRRHSESIWIPFADSQAMKESILAELNAKLE